jgi:hypothetical protein
MNKLKKGRYGEYYIILRLLEEGYEIYTSLVDDRGVDLVVKNVNGNFIEVQIKSVWERNWFQIQSKSDKKNLIKDNYFVIGLDINKFCWIFPSKVFFENCTICYKKDVYTYDLQLYAKKREKNKTRGEELKMYKENWDLLSSI